MFQIHTANVASRQIFQMYLSSNALTVRWIFQMDAGCGEYRDQILQGE